MAAAEVPWEHPVGKVRKICYAMLTATPGVVPAKLDTSRRMGPELVSATQLNLEHWAPSCAKAVRRAARFVSDQSRPISGIPKVQPAWPGSSKWLWHCITVGSPPA